MNELIEMINKYGAQNIVAVCGNKHHKEVLQAFKKWLANVVCITTIPDEETLYFVLKEDFDNIPGNEIEKEFDNWVAVLFDDVMDHIYDFYATVAYYIFQ